MSDYFNELEAFWDEFAEEYEIIQQESALPIAQELCDFLLTQKILPCQTFLDLAGGTGRYLPALQQYVKTYDLVDISKKMLSLAATKADSHVRLIKQAQEIFLSQHTHRYDLVFSAMNPALQTQADLLAFCQASRDWCLIFRLVKEEDQLFSPYEKINPDLLLNEHYKQLLADLKIPYHTKRFCYSQQEMIHREFFQAYFSNEFSPAELANMIKQNFGTADQKLNQSFFDFELIYFQVSNAYNKKEVKFPRS